MATIYFEEDVDAELLKTCKVAVIGFGSQGHAHALNLMDQGVDIRVALYPESKSWQRAEHAGLTVVTVPEAARWADILMFCTPDVGMKAIYCEHVVDHLRPGQTILFAHGFNIHYRLIEPPSFVNVSMVSPKGPGPGLRSEFVAGRGLPALVAVHQDFDGRALRIALSYAWGIGCARALMLETTFREETETDLFGEQAVLCGGIVSLVKAGFDTLVEAGYQPEAAYFECLHETKLIVDLLVKGGLTHMNRMISDTAEWGGYIAGPKVVNDQSKLAMRELLKDIQSGEFARTWVAENEAGKPKMEKLRETERSLRVESVGRELRSLMPFLDSSKSSESEH
jgi:ketol-acid reductoisomerase